MNIYNLAHIEKCYVCGNIDTSLDKFIKMLTSNIPIFEKKEHPKEAERKRRKASVRMESITDGFLRPIFEERSRNKKKTLSYDNSLIVVSGNSGIGLKKRAFYEELFSHLEKILAANNCYLFFVRGNNDDPSYFENRLIDFEHIKTIPDYSVIVLKTYNCLCIGGSVSIDKEWKLSQEKTFGKKCFFENESPLLDEAKLDEILDSFKISCVITSTSPSFAPPSTNSFRNSKWFAHNAEMVQEFSKERKVMDAIYAKFVDRDSKPFLWLYGRFKLSQEAKRNDILFSSLSQYQIIFLNETMSTHFGIDTSKKVGDNDQSFETPQMNEVKLSSRFSNIELDFNEQNIGAYDVQYRADGAEVEAGEVDEPMRIPF